MKDTAGKLAKLRNRIVMAKKRIKVAENAIETIQAACIHDVRLGKQALYF